MAHLKSLAAGILLIASCSKKESNFDASGSFEATETIISAEAAGTILQFNLEEGEQIPAGKAIGYIDSLQLYLKKQQTLAQMEAVTGKKPNLSLQIAALESQLKNAEKEQLRLTNLVKADAATPKQLDDMNAQIEVLKNQIAAQKSTLTISTSGIGKDALPLSLQAQQLEDQLKKCKIINPIAGTVLTKYAEAFEMTSPGKPLYKIADLSNMFLRAYITGNQLPQIKIGQKVNIQTDNGKGGFHQSEGTITWINDKAEFTPKTIQTKDERANMVYAVKVKVKNNGSYKIGMYGEIKFL